MDEVLRTAVTIAWWQEENIWELPEVKDLTSWILKPEVSQHITFEEALIVSNWIIDENKTHKHMIEKTPAEIMEEVNSGLWYVARINWEIVGCVCMIEMTLSNWEKIYEAWSLIASQEKRWHWIWKVLAQAIFWDDKKAVYSITEVPSVKHIYWEIMKLWQLLRDGVNPEVLAKIEEVWALLPTDVIYANRTFLQLNSRLW